MQLYSMKKILVCTDFSEASDHALRAAGELLSRNGGSLDILYVSEIGLHLDEVLNETMKKTYRTAFLGDLSATMNAKMQDQMNRCGVQGNTIYRDGKVSEIILNMANEGNHDLLVMGHGQRTIMRQILGSTVFKIISSTPLPLLVTKIPLKLGRVAGLVDESREMDQIILGTLDFLRNFQCEEAEFISLWMDFPQPFGNNDTPTDIEKKLREQVEHFCHEADKVSIRVEPTRELKLAYPLVEMLKEDKIDIAILKRFTSGNLKRVYIGSTTKRLIEIFEGNVLILPPNN
jgi:nucleotide-binding universal stress UspA family protein